MRYPFDRFAEGTAYGVPGKAWRCGWHSGWDLVSVAAGGDGLVYPVYGGEVIQVGRSGSYGKCVYVRHPDGYVTLYAHLREVYVKKGMTVQEKTVLGIEGATGNVTGRHLHIEVHRGAYEYPAGIDPKEFIERRMMEEAEENEMVKNIQIRLNGEQKTVAAIEKDGYNYVRLQDLRDGSIAVAYDPAAGMPVVNVVKSAAAGA